MEFSAKQFKREWKKLGRNLLSNWTEFALSSSQTKQTNNNNNNNNHDNTGITNNDTAVVADADLHEMEIAPKTVQLPCIIVSTGTFSPVHRMHIKSFELGRKAIESYTSTKTMKTQSKSATQTCNYSYKYKVLGGYISPTHDSYCKSKLGNLAIVGQHRIEMLKLAIQESHNDHWISVSEYHPNCQHMVSINEEMEYVQSMAKHVLPADVYQKLVIFYLCGSDLAIKCRFGHGFGRYGVCIIQREADPMHRQWINDRHARQPIILIDTDTTEQETEDAEAEDSNVSRNDIKNASSTQLRNHILQKQLINGITFNNVQQYMIQFDILGASVLSSVVAEDNNDNNNSNNSIAAEDTNTKTTNK